jgi:phosphoenolpyruvate carboxylase
VKKRNKPSRYQVGFGKPPRETQFQPGTSGNLNGRPKGSPNLATTLARALRERVTINENGERRQITKLEAAVKQLANKAATGDLNAMKQMVSLVRAAEEQQAVETPVTQELGDIDQKVMQNILKRLSRSFRGEP